jgi:SAM-dependent methyltransferase
LKIPSERSSVARALRGWWREEASSAGFWRTLRGLVALLWQFARESTPSQRRQRYGDVDYDWDFRVDTTSATVGWRERLLGLFHSPYQPTDPALFHRMLAELKIDFRGFTFVDIGSGKGRVLLMAADYRFRRVLGVELLPSLHCVAEENIRNYKSDSRRCWAVESACMDARRFEFPPEPTVLYLFNPLPEPGLIEMLSNLEISLRDHPRTVYVLYHNPLLEHVLARSVIFKKIAGTHQYSVFASVAA